MGSQKQIRQSWKSCQIQSVGLHIYLERILSVVNREPQMLNSELQNKREGRPCNAAYPVWFIASALMTKGRRFQALGATVVAKMPITIPLSLRHLLVHEHVKVSTKLMEEFPLRFTAFCWI
uniref:Diphthine synthase n=1 Tax=Anthurium amnicola TaxID=1678845 RepID=A0A1D1Y5K2_9ARAE